MYFEIFFRRREIVKCVIDREILLSNGYEVSHYN